MTENSRFLRFLEKSQEKCSEKKKNKKKINTVIIEKKAEKRKKVFLNIEKVNYNFALRAKKNNKKGRKKKRIKISKK